MDPVVIIAPTAVIIVGLLLKTAEWWLSKDKTQKKPETVLQNPTGEQPWWKR